MGKTLKQHTIYAHDWGPYSDSGEAHFPPPQISNIQSIQDKINECINNDDGCTLLGVLQNDFVFTVLDGVHKYRNDSSGGGTETSEYVLMEAQPVTEVLYLHHRDIFMAMLERLIKEKKPCCVSTFTSSMKESDLDVLMKWDDDVSASIRKGLIEMQNYGGKLKTKGIAKGQTAVDLVEVLKRDLAKIDEQKQTPLQKLRHKIEFVTMLHSHDKEFENHRNYSKVIGINAILGLIGFGVGYAVAGGIHKYHTGRFAFFSQTKTEENVANVHASIDPERKLVCQ